MGGVPELQPWMVRLLGRSGAVAGAGLLVTERQVLTCAHVVHDGALAEFADSAGEPPITTRILSDAYVPLTDSQRGDLALVELDQPQPRRDTAMLRRFPLGSVSTFRAYGFPPDNVTGVWAMTTLVGEAGPGGEWIQLTQAGGGAVRRGFSGSGVLAHPYGRVVGMMVAAHQADEQSFMIPAATIHRYLGDQPWISGPSAIPPELSARPLPRRPDQRAVDEIGQVIRGLAGDNLRVVVVGPDDSDRSAALHQAVRDNVGFLGGIDLMVDCAGLGAERILARIADRAAVEPGELTGDRAPVMVVVLHRVDLAVDPHRRLPGVIERLSERHHLLTTFASEESAMLTSLQSLEGRSSRRSRAGGELDATRDRLVRAELAERSAAGLHRRARLAVVDPPTAPAAAADLRARFTALEAAAGDGKDIRGAAGALRRAAEVAAGEALGVRDRLDALLSRHTRLRGRLTAYRQLAAEYGCAKDPAVTARYRLAYGLLHDAPVDLDDAEGAVDDFAGEVRKWRR
ncbi:trypsin-like peptidase domain-containing protein [Actinoplanes sp. NPDC049265]|uniref:trypsin-like peptidase domain-containing protein n=1 Tax=Actinoplanes sp. NPDC049265 TaxID=3363902 RepID=UPI00371CAC69